MDAQQLQMVDTKDYNVDDQVLQEINNGQTDEGLAVIARHSDEDNDIEIKHEKINQSKNQILTIVTTIFIAYSVIVSTIALILALNNNSTTLPSTTSCDCSLQSFAAKQDPITSGFCDLIDQCIVLETAESTHYPSTDPSNYPSKYPSTDPSNYPSKYPSNYPSKYPSLTLSKFPSTSPTLYPTIEPTMEPTESPTYFDGYFIGDFKFSLQNSDHGFWRLCDGEGYRIDGPYKALFAKIGFIFGGYNNTILNATYQYFRIPNISDGSTIAVAGNGYSIGDTTGSETMTLTENELPSHRHYGFVNSIATTQDWSAYAAAQTLSNFGDPYIIRGHWDQPNGKPTSYTGSGTSFSLMQPTTFIGHLFIYSGVGM